VVSEIRQTVEVFGTEHFILFDDALLINKTERFTGIFSQVAGRFDVGFHTPNGLHAREIDRNTADLLFASGFKTIRLGFESTNPKILEKSDRKLNVRQMAEAVDHLKRAGFAASDIEVYLLFGVPGQGMKGIRESLAHVRDLGVVPRLAVYSPVPGTPDFLELQRRDILSAEPDPYETNKIYFLYRKTGFSEGDITDIKDFTREIARSNRTEVDIHRHRC
jgi:radical SAM superfamily enzyme YgiQ (UPF0313 family)